MKFGCFALLAMGLTVGAAQADTGIRPLLRPASMEAAADPVFAPENDVKPLLRPASKTVAETPVTAGEAVQTALVAAPMAATVAMALPSGAITPLPRAESALQARPTVLPSQVMTAGPSARVVLSVSTSGQPAPMMMRPRLRPSELALLDPPVTVTPLAALAVSRSLRPEPRPALQAKRAAEPEAEVIKAAVVRVLPGKEGVVGKKGSICGDPSIKGQTIAPITSKVRGCGVGEAVMVTSVSGVKLSDPATIDCGTARSLNAWVAQGLQPQFASNPVVQLQVAGHYTCRPRNNIKGNKISEHGRGKAIDISGFVLASGELLSIASDWRSKGDGRLIKAAHKAACGVFNTTLGPGSDGHHEDHLHFDTASGRGPYCR